MNSSAYNTNTFPGPPTRSFDPSADSAPTASAGPGTSAATSTASAGHTPTPTPLLIDLPGHTCLTFLDKGGMGLVSLYHERQHDRQVAVKLCPVGADTRQTVIDRFVREYETLQHLDHPNVVRVYQVGQIPGFVYYSMRYVPTGTLVRQVKAVRASARRAAEFVRKLAAAVEYVHQRNVRHRDLKPGNILVDERGDPLLADFGLAWVDDGHTTTLGGGPFGTPAYMAPEVVRYGPGGCTERSDIWAVGVILYELLAGCRPFVAETNDTAELYRRIRHAPPPPVHNSADALPDVDERLETICLKCLAKSPAHRYQSAGELADDLQRWLDGQPPTLGAQPDAPDVRSAAELPADAAPTRTMPEAQPKPPGRWQPKVAAAALVAVLLTAAVLSATLWPKPPVKKTLAERLLKPGDFVEFVDANGKLVEWTGEQLVGFAGEGSARPGPDGYLELTSTGHYCLELADEPLPFPHEFEWEVRWSRNADGSATCGGYATRRTHAQPNGDILHTCYLCGFDALVAPQGLPQRWVKKVPGYSTVTVFHPKDRTGIAFRPISGGQPLPEELPRQAGPGPFHTLAVRGLPGEFQM